MREYDYDYFVIGAGSAGVRSARIASSHGAKVGIAEASALGGTCVNLGCVPKKIMAYGSDYSMHFEDAKNYGWDVPEVAFDWNTLIKNQLAEVAWLNTMFEKTLTNAGVEIFHGHASFIDPHTLDVGGETITAENILIAVGGRPRIPSQPGGDLMATSDDMFSWPKAPKRAVIVGGGYVAVEFAHILHGAGAHVDLIYRGNLFLKGFDSELSETLAAEMQKAGVGIHFNTDLKSCEKIDDDHYIVHSECGKTFECDLPLAAIGRVPKTGTLKLENASVNVAKNGSIPINEYYETSQPHIFACGDIANSHNLTPVAIKEGHVLADRLFNRERDRYVQYKNIATAIFSQPPIATVGMCEVEATDKGYDIEVFKSSFTPLRNRVAKRDEKSFMKLVVDKKTDKVLGVHMVGLDAPEIIQGFAIALNCGATKADFDKTMPVHPTSAEEFVTMR